MQYGVMVPIQCTYYNTRDICIPGLKALLAKYWYVN